MQAKYIRQHKVSELVWSAMRNMIDAMKNADIEVRANQELACAIEKLAKAQKELYLMPTNQ